MFLNSSKPKLYGTVPIFNSDPYGSICFELYTLTVSLLTINHLAGDPMEPPQRTLTLIFTYSYIVLSESVAMEQQRPDAVGRDTARQTRHCVGRPRQ